jgi:hypothetical protein
MIDWTDELVAQIGSYSRAVLSYPGLDGYPVALPLPFTFDPVEHSFSFPIPPMPDYRPAFSPEDRVSLTLLHYDPQAANERYLLFYGQLAERGHEWYFTPLRVAIPRWGRKREDSV